MMKNYHVVLIFCLIQCLGNPLSAMAKEESKAITDTQHDTIKRNLLALQDLIETAISLTNQIIEGEKSACSGAKEMRRQNMKKLKNITSTIEMFAQQIGLMDKVTWPKALQDLGDEVCASMTTEIDLLDRVEEFSESEDESF